jgi:hypothetical protein
VLDTAQLLAAAWQREEPSAEEGSSGARHVSGMVRSVPDSGHHVFLMAIVNH